MDTVSNQYARERGGAAPFRLLRPRTMIYAAILVAVSALMVFGLGTRSTLDVSLLRDRNPLFVSLSDGTIRNGYTFKIVNRARADRAFVLTLEGIPDATFSIRGGPSDVQRTLVGARPDRVEAYRVFVRAPRGGLDGDSTPLRFVVEENAPDGENSVQDTVFRGPK